MKKLILCIVVVQACSFGFDGKRDMELLPHTISGVFSADLKQTENLRFTHGLRQKAEHRISLFKEITGIELTGIESITCATEYPSGNIPEDKSMISEYIILHGDFDPPRIISSVRDAKNIASTVVTYRGSSIIHTQNSENAFCFLDRARCAAGNLACVKKIIDVQNKKTHSAARNPKTAAVRLPENQRTFLWGIYRAPEKNTRQGRERFLEDRIQSYTDIGLEANIQTVHRAHLDPVDYVHFTLIAQYRSFNEADKIASGLKQFKNQIENLKRYAHRHGINIHRHKIRFSFLESMTVANKRNILLFKFRCYKGHFREYFHGTFMEELLDVMNTSLKPNKRLQVIQDNEAF